jgi:hypothetical protein
MIERVLVLLNLLCRNFMPALNFEGGYMSSGNEYIDVSIDVQQLNIMILDKSGKPTKPYLAATTNPETKEILESEVVLQPEDVQPPFTPDR